MIYGQIWELEYLIAMNSPAGCALEATREGRQRSGLLALLQALLGRAVRCAPPEAPWGGTAADPASRRLGATSLLS